MRGRRLRIRHRLPHARRLDSSGFSGVAERTSRLGYARQIAERSFDIVTPIVLATATFVVHPLGTVLRQPFWLDEAWVASVARAPLRQWLDLSSSSPLGWQFVVRLFTFGHGESARLVTLAFAAGAVAVAYLAVRQLPWPSRVSARGAALATSVTVLVAPVSLFRNDLKQYNADTFVAILLVMLAWRVEAQRSRRALIVFAVATVVVLPFSSIAPFVALPLFGGLLAGAFIAGSRKYAIETLTIGAVALGADALYFAVVVLPHDNSALRAFWRSRYLSGSSLHVVNTASHSFHALSPLFGMPSLFLGLLVIAGCATLVCLRRPAVAIAIALLWTEMFILGIARRYPFLDARTSTFLLETSLLVATVGFAGVVIAAARASRVLAVVIVVGATLGYGHSVAPAIRCRSIPFEDARTMTDYVSRSRRPGDTIVVSFGASYSFAYYLRHARVHYVPTKAQAN